MGRIVFWISIYWMYLNVKTYKKVVQNIVAMASSLAKLIGFLNDFSLKIAKTNQTWAILYAIFSPIALGFFVKKISHPQAYIEFSTIPSGSQRKVSADKYHWECAFSVRIRWTYLALISVFTFFQSFYQNSLKGSKRWRFWSRKRLHIWNQTRIVGPNLRYLDSSTEVREMVEKRNTEDQFIGENRMKLSKI